MKRTIRSEFLLAQAVPIILFSIIGAVFSVLVIVKGWTYGHWFKQSGTTLGPLMFIAVHTFFYIVLCAVCLGVSALVSGPITARITRNLKALTACMAGRDDCRIGFDYDILQAVADEGMQAQREVKALGSMRDTMLSNCPWGYAIADSSGMYIDINRQGLSMLGYEREEFLGKRVGGISVDGKGAISDVLATGNPSSKEIEVVSGGVRKTILSHAFPITLLNGDSGVMTWFFDLTPWSEMQRLSAIGEMVSIIAHDVRNPLAAIKSKAQMACLIPDRVDNIKEWTRVSELVDEVTAYLTKLLSFSKGTGASREGTVPGSELIRSALSVLRNKLAFTKIEVEEDMEEPSPRLSVDPVEFQHVLMNLISNSLDALEGRGHLRITCRRTGNGTVSIGIGDDGKGIPPEVLPNIWEMFFTTKPQGSGIGLAVCRKAVEKAGGTISVASTVGVGTTFTIELPNPELRKDTNRDQESA